MPEFLSEAWLAALDDAARSRPPLPGVAPLVIQLVVVDQAMAETSGAADLATDAAVTIAQRYHLDFSDSGLRVRGGLATRADVTVTMDQATAVFIARGETNAQRALADGRIRIGGDIEALVRRAAALRAMDDALGAVRAATTYR